jgi:PAS domain S-box-containing protein
MEKIRILHLEDDLADSELVLHEFDSAGYDIDYTRVENKKEFTRQLEHKQFDIILADNNLPTYDGISALKLCSADYPGIPFVFVSGTMGEEIAVKMLKFGAADYLLKQNLKRLIPAVEHALEEARQKQEKIKTENELKASEEKYRSIFENIQDVFYQLDSNGNITEISPSVQRLSGFKREELLGKPSAMFYYSADDSKILMEILAQSHEVWDFEIRMRTNDERLKYISVNAHSMYDSAGIFAGTEGTLRDIDERKHFEIKLKEAKEKAEESDHLKTAFLHNISHEIRTPMNAIIGFSSLLGIPGTKPETEGSYIRTIQDGCNQLLSIINDIVDISSIEANIIHKHVSRVNINEVLNNIYNLYRLKAKENGNTLKICQELSDELAILQTDDTKLNQIISNLLNNAFKFTSNGQVEFGYKLKESMIEFFVSDTGIGIPPEHHAKVFNNFYQVEFELSRRFGGIGLGLTISKAYTELLGGKIWMNSEPGKGSVFYFTLPYSNFQPEAPLKKEMETTRDFTFAYPVTILVAEDDNQNFELIINLLNYPGVKIVRAANGKEAVEICKTKIDLDLVLMDVKMPVMDGFTATGMIKEIRPLLPVIAQTAYNTDLDKAISSGCVGFLAKPYRKEKLLAIIQEHIRKRK